MKKQTLPSLITIALVVTGCSVLTSRQYSTASTGTRGIPYYLPLGKIHLQVKETTTKETVTHSSKSKKTPTDPSASATPADFNDVDLNTDNEVTTSVIKTKTHSLELVGVSYTPDPNFQFVLDYHGAATAEDDVKVTIGSDGLLTKIDVTSEDKTAAIILKLVDIAKEVAKISTLSEGETTSTTIVVYDATFDPFDPVESAKVKNDLRAFHCSYKILRISGNEADVSKTVVTRETETHRINGVAFRPVFAYNLHLQNDGTPALLQTVFLPNQAQVMSLPVTRAAFVKKVTTLGFDHGILTDVHISKPSEVLGFLEIPLGIAKAIVDLPAELIKLRIDTTKSNTDLLTAQKAGIEAQQALDELRARAASSSSSPPGAASTAANHQP
jgi:hypothetical protein